MGLGDAPEATLGFANFDAADENVVAGNNGKMTPLRPSTAATGSGSRRFAACGRWIASSRMRSDAATQGYSHARRPEA
jgi:hypothetical protein